MLTTCMYRNKIKHIRPWQCFNMCHSEKWVSHPDMVVYLCIDNIWSYLLNAHIICHRAIFKLRILFMLQLSQDCDYEYCFRHIFTSIMISGIRMTHYRVNKSHTYHAINESVYWDVSYLMGKHQDIHKSVQPSLQCADVFCFSKIFKVYHV